MKAIKKISGDILLILYVLQRKRRTIEGESISFNRNMNDKDDLEYTEIGRILLSATNSRIADIYNVFNYLFEKRFINFDIIHDSENYTYTNIRVTANGTDIIEGIERGEKEKQEIHINFNIKLADSVNLESLIKNEVGSLIKASLI